VWQGTVVTKDQYEEFNEFIKEMGATHDVVIVGSVDVEGRTDFFFYVHNDDIGKIAVRRLQYGIRWWEDIFFNNKEHEYPESFKNAYPPKW
jgi:hypothetical protein